MSRTANDIAVLPPRLRLPRDATVQFNTQPTELYVSLTITRVEHIHALYEVLETFSRLLEDDR
jgi:hypothetical protein